MMSVSCTICQDDLFTGEDDKSVSSTICGHVYHSHCLFQWMERSETCPHCRTDLEDDDVFKLNLLIEKASAVPRMETFELDVIRYRVEYLRIETDLCIAVEKTKKLEDQVQCLLRSESNLKNELAAKNKKLLKMRKDFKTVNSMNEKLKKENYELENSIEKHLDVEDDLKDKLDEETVILENTKEDLDEANLANKKLKKKNIELERSIEQHLKVEADLKKKLDTITKAFNDMEFLGQTELFILRAEKQKYEVDTLKSKDTIEKLRAEVLHEQRKNHSLLKKLSDQSKSSIVRQNEKLKTKLKKKNDVIKVEIEELKIRQKNLKKLLTKLKNKQSRC